MQQQLQFSEFTDRINTFQFNFQSLENITVNQIR